jgi:hypothetical protein
VPEEIGDFILEFLVFTSFAQIAKTVKLGQT